MLRRSQVARRLRRSISSVRRLERHELFPVLDARGVHWFDECEVDALARRLARGEITAAQGAWLSGGEQPRRRAPAAETRDEARSDRGRSDSSARLEHELEALKKENAELRERVRAFILGVETLLERGPVDEALEMLELGCSGRVV
jgi:hypothetical protein